ncbi:MAG TPA: peptidase MA family metallohydrolase [Polyangiales bacterium]|nr:peptidase MA family metallohydrolase [Polyangiales bacterium]
MLSWIELVAGFRQILAQDSLAFRLAALVICAATGLLVGSARADDSAQAAPLTDPPAGYATEREGNVRWTYPLSAADEVGALRTYQRLAWRRVVSELGASVSDTLDIRVALNPEQMQTLAPPNSALPGYADGIAFPKSGLVLLTLTAPETFFRPDMNRVLTHELSHVALERAVRGAALPRWFSEGVAVHQAGESSLTRIETLWNATLRGNLLSLAELSNAFPNGHSQIDLAYAQSADFVGFMLDGHDERGHFHALLRELANGKAFPEAVQATYHVPLSYLEREWRAGLQRHFGRWPALFMGLTVVWVLGAVLLGIAFVRTRLRHRATLRRWAIEEAPILSAPPPPPQPAGATQSSVDEFFENRRTQSDSGVPTVIHDGQHHTLH